MAQIDKNTVESKNQLGKNPFITYENTDGMGKRVLFVGNSITRHAPKSDIGWNNDWGMAASEKDRDYVHLVKKAVLDNDSDATFCICQVAEWERKYKEGEEQIKIFSEAREFDADLIIMRITENCDTKVFDKSIFKNEYINFVKFLDKNSKAKVIITSSFWKHPGDEVLEKIASENRWEFVYMGDLGELDEMKATGLFEHSGVAAHPGDLGMKKIAERIIEKI